MYVLEIGFSWGAYKQRYMSTLHSHFLCGGTFITVLVCFTVLSLLVRSVFNDMLFYVIMSFFGIYLILTYRLGRLYFACGIPLVSPYLMFALKRKISISYQKVVLTFIIEFIQVIFVCESFNQIFLAFFFEPA